MCTFSFRTMLYRTAHVMLYSGLGEYLSRSNLVLDSVVTDNVVVKCQGKSSDDVMNWGQALDAFLSTAGQVRCLRVCA